MIEKFDGIYSFLSNFYICGVTYEDIKYTSSEAAFQSAKSLDRSVRLQFVSMLPRDAKKYGRKIKIRDDWEDVKYSVMKDIVRCKFEQHHHLAEQLIETGDEYIQEGNYWNDTYWGVCNGVGENNLGKILMEIREELKKENL